MQRAAAYLIFLSALALSGNSFLVRADTPGEDLTQTINYLLDFVVTSDCTFIRNGWSYTPKEASDHIKAKYNYFKKEIKTAEDFIRLAATKSEVSGRPYLVRTKTGQEMKSADWLSQALDDYRASRSISPDP
ncbi:MAG TPA: DUF5329 family protein [Candidatus Binatia bacterium]|jgi:hypothetical protein